MKHLNNYRNLVQKVDERCRSIQENYGEHIACQKGCDGCCRHISLFPVEARALAEALQTIPAEEAARIRQKARTASTDAPCPLLEDGLCQLYNARPIICRTHGLPILTVQNGKRMVDFCPLNFVGLTSLPADAIISLDRLNETLAAINALFVRECPSALPPVERLSIAEALLLRIE